MGRLHIVEARLASQDILISKLQKTVATFSTLLDNQSKRNADFQRILEANQPDTHAPLAEKMSLLEKEMNERVSTLSRDVEEKAKTWASIVKGNPGFEPASPPSIHAIISEQETRAKKALHIRVRGCADEGDALQAAKGILQRLHAPLGGLSHAWWSKFQPGILFMHFTSLTERTAVLKLRAQLKGTRIFFDDDLTHTQLVARKATIQEARAKDQRVVFIDGRARFFPLKK